MQKKSHALNSTQVGEDNRTIHKIFIAVSDMQCAVVSIRIAVASARIVVVITILWFDYTKCQFDQLLTGTAKNRYRMGLLS